MKLPDRVSLRDETENDSGDKFRKSTSRNRLRTISGQDSPSVENNNNNELTYSFSEDMKKASGGIAIIPFRLSHWARIIRNSDIFSVMEKGKELLSKAEERKRKAREEALKAAKEAALVAAGYNGEPASGNREELGIEVTSGKEWIATHAGAADWSYYEYDISKVEAETELIADLEDGSPQDAIEQELIGRKAVNKVYPTPWLSIAVNATAEQCVRAQKTAGGSAYLGKIKKPVLFPVKGSSVAYTSAPYGHLYNAIKDIIASYMRGNPLSPKDADSYSIMSLAINRATTPTTLPIRDELQEVSDTVLQDLTTPYVTPVKYESGVLSSGLSLSDAKAGKPISINDTRAEEILYSDSVIRYDKVAKSGEEQIENGYYKGSISRVREDELSAAVGSLPERIKGIIGRTILEAIGRFGDRTGSTAAASRRAAESDTSTVAENDSLIDVGSQRYGEEDGIVGPALDTARWGKTYGNVLLEEMAGRRPSIAEMDTYSLENAYARALVATPVIRKLVTDVDGNITTVGKYGYGDLSNGDLTDKISIMYSEVPPILVGSVKKNSSGISSTAFDEGDPITFATEDSIIGGLGEYRDGKLIIPKSTLLLLANYSDSTKLTSEQTGEEYLLPNILIEGVERKYRVFTDFMSDSFMKVNQDIVRKLGASDQKEMMLHGYMTEFCDIQVSSESESVEVISKEGDDTDTLNTQRLVRKLEFVPQSLWFGADIDRDELSEDIKDDSVSDDLTDYLGENARVVKESLSGPGYSITELGPAERIVADEEESSLNVVIDSEMVRTRPTDQDYFLGKAGYLELVTSLSSGKYSGETESNNLTLKTEVLINGIDTAGVIDQLKSTCLDMIASQYEQVPGISKDLISENDTTLGEGNPYRNEGGLDRNSYTLSYTNALLHLLLDSTVFTSSIYKEMEKEDVSILSLKWYREESGTFAFGFIEDEGENRRRSKRFQIIDPYSDEPSFTLHRDLVSRLVGDADEKGIVGTIEGGRPGLSPEQVTEDLVLDMLEKARNTLDSIDDITKTKEKTANLLELLAIPASSEPDDIYSVVDIAIDDLGATLKGSVFINTAYTEEIRGQVRDLLIGLEGQDKVDAASKARDILLSVGLSVVGLDDDAMLETASPIISSYLQVSSVARGYKKADADNLARLIDALVDLSKNNKRVSEYVIDDAPDFSAILGMNKVFEESSLNESLSLVDEADFKNNVISLVLERCGFVYTKDGNLAVHVQRTPEGNRWMIPMCLVIEVEEGTYQVLDIRDTSSIEEEFIGPFVEELRKDNKVEPDRVSEGGDEKRVTLEDWVEYMADKSNGVRMLYKVVDNAWVSQYAGTATDSTEEEFLYGIMDFHRELLPRLGLISTFIDQILILYQYVVELDRRKIAHTSIETLSSESVSHVRTQMLLKNAIAVKEVNDEEVRLLLYLDEWYGATRLSRRGSEVISKPLYPLRFRDIDSPAGTGKDPSTQLIKDPIEFENKSLGEQVISLSTRPGRMGNVLGVGSIGYRCFVENLGEATRHSLSNSGRFLSPGSYGGSANILEPPYITSLSRAEILDNTEKLSTYSLSLLEGAKYKGSIDRTIGPMWVATPPDLVTKFESGRYSTDLRSGVFDVDLSYLSAMPVMIYKTETKREIKVSFSTKPVTSSIRIPLEAWAPGGFTNKFLSFSGDATSLSKDKAALIGKLMRLSFTRGGTRLSEKAVTQPFLEVLYGMSVGEVTDDDIKVIEGEDKTAAYNKIVELINNETIVDSSRTRNNLMVAGGRAEPSYGYGYGTYPLIGPGTVDALKVLTEPDKVDERTTMALQISSEDVKPGSFIYATTINALSKRRAIVGLSAIFDYFVNSKDVKKIDVVETPRNPLAGVYFKKNPISTKTLSKMLGDRSFSKGKKKYLYTFTFVPDIPETIESVSGLFKELLITTYNKVLTGSSLNHIDEDKVSEKPALTGIGTGGVLSTSTSHRPNRYNGVIKALDSFSVVEFVRTARRRGGGTEEDGKRILSRMLSRYSAKNLDAYSEYMGRVIDAASRIPEEDRTPENLSYHLNLQFFNLPEDVALSMKDLTIHINTSSINDPNDISLISAVLASGGFFGSKEAVPSGWEEGTSLKDPDNSDVVYVSPVVLYLLHLGDELTEGRAVQIDTDVGVKIRLLDLARKIRSYNSNPLLTEEILNAFSELDLFVLNSGCRVIKVDSKGRPTVGLTSCDITPELATKKTKRNASDIGWLVTNLVGDIGSGNTGMSSRVSSPKGMSTVVASDGCFSTMKIDGSQTILKIVKSVDKEGNADIVETGLPDGSSTTELLEPFGINPLYLARLYLTGKYLERRGILKAQDSISKMMLVSNEEEIAHLIELFSGSLGEQHVKVVDKVHDTVAVYPDQTRTSRVSERKDGKLARVKGTVKRSGYGRSIVKSSNVGAAGYILYSGDKKEGYKVFEPDTATGGLVSSSTATEDIKKESSSQYMSAAALCYIYSLLTCKIFIGVSDVGVEVPEGEVNIQLLTPTGVRRTQNNLLDASGLLGALEEWTYDPDIDRFIKLRGSTAIRKAVLVGDSYKVYGDNSLKKPVVFAERKESIGAVTRRVSAETPSGDGKVLRVMETLDITETE